jgi:hypothetical protein
MHEFLPPEPFFRFSQRTCPMHYFRSKTHVWGGFAQFRCRTSPILKTVVVVHTKHEFLPLEPFLRFSQRTFPIHYFRSKTHVWVVSRNFIVAHHPFRKRVSGAYKARVFATRTISSFFATNMPNPLLWVQNSCLGWFRAISLPHVTHSENGSRGVHTKHEFLPPEPFLRFSLRTCPIHYFRYKTHVWGAFAQFRCRTSPIPKTGVGCIKARVFATRTISSFFATNMPNPLL